MEVVGLLEVLIQALSVAWWPDPLVLHDHQVQMREQCGKPVLTGVERLRPLALPFEKPWSCKGVRTKDTYHQHIALETQEATI